MHAQEVELDIDTKLRNIEATERSKAKLEEEASRAHVDAGAQDVTLIPKNYNANFSDHRHSWQNRAPSTTYADSKRSGRGATSKQSSDDIAMGRFKARDRNFRR